MNEQPATDSGRQLGAFDIGCVVIGGIIGVGIFFTPSKVAAVVGSSTQALAAWSIGGFLAVLGALVFADLSRRVPGHGGTFIYIHEAFGSALAFLYGWANWLIIQSGALGVIGLIMVDYADQLVYGEPTTSMATKIVITVVAIAFFTILNLLGLRVGKRVQNGLTVAKTLAVFSIVLLAVITTGGAAAEVAAVAQPSKGWLEAMAAAMLPVLFSFGGWQQGSFLAGAARRPLRDVPLGIICGVLVVVLAYLSVNFAFLHLLGLEGAARSKTIAVDATEIALAPYGMGDIAGRVLGAMVVLSCLGIMNTILMAPPYVLHEMSQRGLFFASMGRLHPRHASPTTSILIQGVWASILLVGAWLLLGGTPTDTLGFLLDGVVFVDWLFFALCGLALLRLQRRGGDAARGFSVVAGLFALGALAVMVGAVWTKPIPSLVGLALTAAGLLLYAWFRQGRAA
ncbi:MAG: amino acid permease [Planctomycetota bacterium]|jgi:APA family basic amino acid/polyamine antiporter|nr:amino acid permease [Planctomycetota bacterium]